MIKAAAKRGAIHAPVSGRLVRKLGVTRFFKFEREFPPTRFLNGSMRQYVHLIRHDMVQKALVVRDDDHRTVR